MIKWRGPNVRPYVLGVVHRTGRFNSNYLNLLPQGVCKIDIAYEHLNAQSSSHFVSAIFGANTPVFGTAWANFFTSGASLCSCMLCM